MNTKQKRKLSVKRKIRNPNRHILSVFRSNKHIYAQILDPKTGNTVVGASDLGFDKKGKVKSKVEKAQAVGEEIAKLAKKAKIIDVVFNRREFKFHGRVKALAQKAREGGLNF